jgi:xanthine dehydrogenase YagS FAD-binding subunit
MRLRCDEETIMQNIVVIHPESLEDAVQTAHEHGSEAKFYAGGQDLMYRLKRRIASNPKYLIHLPSLPDLSYISFDDVNGLRIGPLTTITALAQSEAVRTHYPALAEAAEAIASPQIRNVGTVAGNLCQQVWCPYLLEDYACSMNGGKYCPAAVGDNSGYHAIFRQKKCVAVHPSDLAPALLAMEAEVTVLGHTGKRMLSMEDLLPGIARVGEELKVNGLRTDEVLFEIQLPPPVPESRQTYRKSRSRQSWDFATVSVAAVLQLDGTDCTYARIVLGGVAAQPVRVHAAEAFLTSHRLDVANLIQAADLALESARPLALNAYKVDLAKALVQDTLEALAVGE